MPTDVERLGARASAKARQADWRSTLARFGLAAKGMLYAALGVLAIQVAAGEASSQSASKRGAIELVASQPLGQWLLGILTFGLFALALWQLILAIQGDPVEGSEPRDRAKFGVKSLIYVGTALTALGVLIAHQGGGGTGPAGGGAGGQQQAAATVMSWPAGRWLVGIVGVVVAGFALQQLYRHAVEKRFMRRLDRAAMRPKVESAVERSGQAGYGARAVVIAIVGVFFVVAAIQHDPNEAVGLSGALTTLAGQSWGQVVLWVVALGLFLYGLFCFGEARYRRAT